MTKMTPFEAVFERPPPNMVGYDAGTTTVAQVDDALTSRDSILRALKQHLTEAQNRMKQQADQHRTEREFAEGDMVFLRLQPYRQNSIATCRSMKLAPRFYGPFRILNRVGKVAYRLELPADSAVHPVFHVSCLKKVIGRTNVPAQALPTFDDQGTLHVSPYRILDRRQVRKRGRTITQILVQWTSLPSEDATWEEAHSIQERFPNFQP
jgi:hypothetical protein